MAGEPVWVLEGFTRRLDEWIDLESPDDDLRLVVTSWVLSRFDDPYQDAHRERGFDNVWFAVVPESAHGDSEVVACSYWVDERSRNVRCDSIATLSWPA